MADLSTKKNSYVSRLVQANADLLAAVDRLANLKAEWDANAYAAGAGTQPNSYNIVDADLVAVAPYLTAAQVGQLVGAHVTVRATVDSNRGYLEAARP